MSQRGNLRAADWRWLADFGFIRRATCDDGGCWLLLRPDGDDAGFYLVWDNGGEWGVERVNGQGPVFVPYPLTPETAEARATRIAHALRAAG